jgi:hypothetical protein
MSSVNSSELLSQITLVIPQLLEELEAAKAEVKNLKEQLTTSKDTVTKLNADIAKKDGELAIMASKLELVNTFISNFVNVVAPVVVTPVAQVVSVVSKQEAKAAKVKNDLPPTFSDLANKLAIEGAPEGFKTVEKKAPVVKAAAVVKQRQHSYLCLYTKADGTCYLEATRKGGFKCDFSHNENESSHATNPSQKKDCNFGDDCYNHDCKYKHSFNWDVESHLQRELLKHYNEASCC